jgi:hypothetical protein
MQIDIVKRNDPNFKYFESFIQGQSSSLCKADVMQSYVRGPSKSSADMIAIAHVTKHSRSTKPIVRVVGFANIRIMQNSLYIDVLCGSGGGRTLVKAIIELAIEMDKKYVQLNALPQVINFYRKMGFMHTRSCKEKDHIQKLSAKFKTLLFRKMDHAITHRAFKTLLSALIKDGLTSEKGCKTIPNCSVEGYTMTKCVLT